MNIRALVDRRMVKKHGFYEFVKRAFSHVQTQKFSDSECMIVICEYCEEIIKTENHRSVINVPPSIGKSSILSILLPVYLQILDPTNKIITISYSPELAQEFSSKSLELMKSKWFQDRWPIEIKNMNQTAKGFYKTVKGGFRLATSPQSKLTGFHANYILIDDPNKASDQKLKHENVIDFFKNTLSTRILPGARMTLVMQRLAHYDVSDYCIQAGWQSLVLPMEFEKANKDPKDWRTKEGQLLVPERLCKASVDALRIALGIFADSQLQQRPSSILNAIFLQSHLDNTFTEIPKRAEICISLDLATYSDIKSDFSAACIGYKQNDNYYIIEDHIFKADFTGQVKKILELREKYKDYQTTVIVEDKSNGPAVFQMLEKEIKGIQLFKVGNRSKLERANAISYLLNTDSVFFKYLTQEAKTQLLTFPKAKNDDFTDSLVQLLLHLSGDQKVQTVWEAIIAKQGK